MLVEAFVLTLSSRARVCPRFAPPGCLEASALAPNERLAAALRELDGDAALGVLALEAYGSGYLQTTARAAPQQGCGPSATAA